MNRYIYMLLMLSVVFISGCTTEEPELSTVEPELNEVVEEISNDPDHSSNETVVEQIFFFPGYEDFDEMVESSNLIIHGRVLDERVELVNTNITLEEAIAARTAEYQAGLMTREELENAIASHHNSLEEFEPNYNQLIFYRVKILEIFQGNYEVGDVIEISEFLAWDEEGNPSLEHSFRYELDSELIFFLVGGADLRIRYVTLIPRQTVYEVPIDLDLANEEVILEPLETLQPEPLEEVDGMETIGGYKNSEPFDINLEILREIAEENGLLDE